MKTFYKAIYDWVAENYGQSEADDPSWSIKALADHLSKTDIKPDELNAKQDLLELCQYILDKWELDTKDIQDRAEKLVKKYGGEEL